MALAELGGTLIVTGRKAGDCAATADQITAAGSVASDLQLDVSDLKSIPERVAAAAALYGPIDILVNNAATIGPQALLGELDAVAFDDALRVNVSGPTALVAALWPSMRGRGGRIVNIVSGASNRAISGWAAYCASKAASSWQWLAKPAGAAARRRASMSATLARTAGTCASRSSARHATEPAMAPSVKTEAAEGGPTHETTPRGSEGHADADMQASIRAVKINDIGHVPRENLLPPHKPARLVAWLASGDADDLAGQFLDIRHEGLMARAGLD